MANYDLSKLDSPALSSTPQLRTLPPPDPRRHLPPFIPIPKIHNFRSLQPFPTSPSGHFRTDLIYRCAEPSPITPQGHAAISKLPIKSVFDLRSADELAKNATRAPAVQIPGTTRYHVPVFGEAVDEASREQHLRFYTESGSGGFVKAYQEILGHGVGAFRRIFEHVRDRPEDGVLVHCTAGKDRTGVFVALALNLVGVDDELIGEEYQLTEAGLSEWAPIIFKVLLQEPALGGDQDGVIRLGSAKKENMMAFLEWMRKKYGGAGGYLKGECSFGDEDIEKIKENLVEKA